MRFRLRTKFLVSMLLILVTLTSTALLLVRRRVEQQLRGQILQDLRNSVATFQNVERQRVVSLRHSGELLADLPILRALMTTTDSATIQDASANLYTLAGSDLLVLADRTAVVMGAHGPAPEADRHAAQELMRQSLKREHSEDWWMVDNRLYEVSLEPIYFGSPSASNVLGFLAVGFEVDDRLARELSQVAASQVAFWYGSSLVHSTLPPVQEAELIRQESRQRAASGEPIEMRLASEQFLVTSVDLGGSSAAPVRLVVLKSLEPANALISELNRLVLGLGFVAVLAGSGVVFVALRRFTRPLDNLVAGVRALERGEYAYPLPIEGNDEAAELTKSFTHMRKSLQQSQRELLDAERLATIGRMASSISHDLRHQLAAILANAEFLSEQRDEKERQELYEELRAAVAQMTDLIESLLEFSRTRESLRLGWVQIREVLERAVQTVRARLEFRSISITVESCEVEGYFDGQKLQRVFQNLLINACEACTLDGGKVSVCARKKDGILEIVFEDNGHGIPDHLRDCIFDPFVSYGKENGTGLGLTVVQKIVQDHGGEVRVEGTSPAGSTIVISLPLLSSPRTARHLPAPAATSAGSDAAQRNPA